jgi:hypothetical protein
VSDQTLVVSYPDPITVVQSYAGGVIITGASSSPGLELVAASNIGGHRIIAADSQGQAIIASSADQGHTHRILGLSPHAANTGTLIKIINQQIVEEPSWQWEAGKPLFLGINGVMIHAPPSLGFLLRCGVAITPTRAYIDIQQPILNILQT